MALVAALVLVQALVQAQPTLMMLALVMLALMTLVMLALVLDRPR